MKAAARVVRRGLRDMWWSLTGPSLSNPAVSRPVESILFVCLGNICRSPFAERIASLQLSRQGRTDLLCRSAGIRASQAAKAPAEACEAAARYGLSLADHRPQQLSHELVRDSDLIVVMEPGQVSTLKAAYPEAADRIVLLPLFDRKRASGYARFHIEDPFMKPLPAFEACYARIERSVEALLDHLAPVNRGASREPAARRVSYPPQFT